MIKYERFNYEMALPTPALGINGLKLIENISIEKLFRASNACFGHKWIETPRGEPVAR